jgi:DNA-binding CsgD family transcriptional regulator
MHAVIPYEADNVAERVRLMAEARAMLERAKGSAAGLLPNEIPFLLLQGDWDQARGLGVAPEFWLRPRESDKWLLTWTAVLLHHQCHPRSAWQQMHALLPNAPSIEPGASLFIWDITAMSHLATQPGFEHTDLEVALVWLTAFDRSLDRSGAVLGRAENAALWAQYHQAAGDLALARERAQQALAFASEPRQPFALIAAHRVMGQVGAAEGLYVEAEQHLRESRELSEACAAPYERALALLALAELRATQGKRNDARELLAEVLEICEPLKARPALDRAETLLAELDAAGQSTVERSILTTREIEVLRLVAQGMIDREIAENLFISPRTVTTHVTHILDKLGVSTRAEAAAYAVREGLI